MTEAEKTVEKARLETELSQVREKREKMLTGEHASNYTLQGRQVNLPALSHLRVLAEEERRILKALSRLNRGGIRIRQGVPR